MKAPVVSCNIEAALAILHVSRRSLYYWMKSGKVRFHLTPSGTRILDLDQRVVDKCRKRMTAPPQEIAQ